MAQRKPTRRPAAEAKRPVKNMLTKLGVDHLDYKDTANLRLFISERGKHGRNVAPGCRNGTGVVLVHVDNFRYVGRACQARIPLTSA